MFTAIQARNPIGELDRKIRDAVEACDNRYAYIRVYPDEEGFQDIATQLTIRGFLNVELLNTRGCGYIEAQFEW